MKKITVSLIQLTSTDDLENNFSKISMLFEEARSQNPSIICLPENFSFFGSEETKLKLGKTIQDRTREFLSSTSKSLGTYILGGGYPTVSPDEKRFYNTASLFNPQGIEIFTYHKIHLFDSEPGDGVSYKESRATYPGEAAPEVIEIPSIGRFSSLICYDLRFPEAFRKLTSQGLEIISIPAAFTVPTGKAHWEVLLRSRAIENFCYVLAPAQTGTHDKNGKRQTYGNSMIVNPWGEVIARLDLEEGVLSAELDPLVLEESRKKVPALQHIVL